VSHALRLTREDGADAAFAYLALLSGAISVSEFIGWTERVIRDTEGDIPDYIFEIGSLKRDKATISDIHALFPNVTGEICKGEDRLLMAISVLRVPEIVQRSDEWRPRDPEKAREILVNQPVAVKRFETFFPGLLP